MKEYIENPLLVKCRVMMLKLVRPLQLLVTMIYVLCFFHFMYLYDDLWLSFINK